MTSLGGHTATTAPQPPGNAAAPAPATRATRPGWRDPRLWIGVSIVAVSVVAGAQLLASADDSVPVWVAASDLAAGDTLAADDLEPSRVRFVDAVDLDRYLPADEALPADTRLLRGIGEGELVPRTALGDAEDLGVLQLPVAVDPSLVPDSVSAGSVVSVYVRGTSRCPECAGPALDGVTVVHAPSVDDLTGTRQLVLAVEQEDADRWFALLADLEAPVVTVLGS